jgi:hypothetical protein
MTKFKFLGMWQVWLERAQAEGYSSYLLLRTRSSGQRTVEINFTLEVIRGICLHSANSVGSNEVL